MGLLKGLSLCVLGNVVYSLPLQFVLTFSFCFTAVVKGLVGWPVATVAST